MKVSKDSWHYKLNYAFSSDLELDRTKCYYWLIAIAVVMVIITTGYLLLALIGNLFWLLTFCQLGWWVIPELFVNPLLPINVLFSIFPLLIGYNCVKLFIYINKYCDKIEFKD